MHISLSSKPKQSVSFLRTVNIWMTSVEINLTLVLSYPPVSSMILCIFSCFTHLGKPFCVFPADRDNLITPILSSVVEPTELNGTDPVEMKARSAQDSTSQSTRELMSSGSGRLTYADEFLRTAHLFLSNLDGDFLWGFLERRFRDRLISISNSATAVNSSFCCKSPRTLNLEQLCSVVQFILSHLPIDTYPSVRAIYLPRLFSFLMDCLLERFQSEPSTVAPSDPIANPVMPMRKKDLTCLLRLLESVVRQVFEVMFIHPPIFPFHLSFHIRH